MRTATVCIDVKSPDEWGNLIHNLALSDAVSRAHFEFGEYATLELEFDETLHVVSGRVVPVASPK